MTIFCFNDCIPSSSKYDFVLHLTKTVVEYNKLFKKYPNDITGVLTGKDFDLFKINQENVSLQQCVAEIRDRETRSFAYSLFDKHPVEEHLPSINAEEILEAEYYLTLDGSKYSAFHPAVISFAGGVLFTVGVHPRLCVHPLAIATKNTERVVDNLYGDDNNTTLIDSKILQEIAAKKGKLDQLLELTTATCSDKFKKAFNNLSSGFQQIVIDHFSKALQRSNGIGLKPDDSLIRATQTPGFNFETYELRIFTPVAYRVYFYHDGGKTYFASLEKKPSAKKQNQDIQAAASTIGQHLTTVSKN